MVTVEFLGLFFKLVLMFVLDLKGVGKRNQYQTPCIFSLKGGIVIIQFDIGGILGIILQVGIYVCIGLERSRKKEDE